MPAIVDAVLESPPRIPTEPLALQRGIDWCDKNCLSLLGVLVDTFNAVCGEAVALENAPTSISHFTCECKMSTVYYEG